MPQARTNADYLEAIQGLLPRGRVWPRESDSVQAQALSGLAPTPQRVDAAGLALLVDAFPATAVDLLPEWEESLGLPDPCAGEAPTIAARQAQVVARFSGGGGQSVPFFIAFAAALGFTITITEFTGSLALANTWRVNVPGTVPTDFEFGVGRFGDPFQSVSTDAEVLQCEFKRLKPAHTVLEFNFF
jgi:uncharacterized protein YmfQ (DUF2313 family)